MIVKSAKRVKLDTKILSAILNTKTLKMIQWYKNVCVLTKVTKKGFMKT